MDPGGIGTIRINGGRLCLDFSNTATYRGAEVLHDFLASYRDLLTWGGRVGLLSRAELRTKLGWAGSHPEQAAGAHAAALRLRAALRNLFLTGPSAANLAHITTINAALADAAASCRITPGAGGYAYAANADAVHWLAGPVAIAAAALATSPDFARVRRCGGQGCEWLFLDLSRAGTRRWCSMASCGNRAKARSHYAKSKPVAARRKARSR